RAGSAAAVVDRVVSARRLGPRPHAQGLAPALPAVAAVGDRGVHARHRRLLGGAPAPRAGGAARRPLRRRRHRRHRVARAPAARAHPLAAPWSPARSPALSPPRLRLTPAAADDVELLVGMHDAPGPPDDARAERVRALVASNAERFAQHGFGLWVVRSGSAAVGWVALRPRESALEPDLLSGLAREGRGKGFATEAASARLDRLWPGSG